MLMYNIILLINLKVNNTNMKNFRKELYAFIPTMYYIKANEWKELYLNDNGEPIVVIHIKNNSAELSFKFENIVAMSNRYFAIKFKTKWELLNNKEFKRQIKAFMSINNFVDSELDSIESIDDLDEIEFETLNSIEEEKAYLSDNRDLSFIDKEMTPILFERYQREILRVKNWDNYRNNWNEEKALIEKILSEPLVLEFLNKRDPHYLEMLKTKVIDVLFKALQITWHDFGKNYVEEAFIKWMWIHWSVAKWTYHNWSDIDIFVQIDTQMLDSDEMNSEEYKNITLNDILHWELWEEFEQPSFESVKIDCIAEDYPIEHLIEVEWKEIICWDTWKSIEDCLIKLV